MLFDSQSRQSATLLRSDCALTVLPYARVWPNSRMWLLQVPEEDMRRVAAATGARVQTTVSKLQPVVLGTCAKFEEVQARACATHGGASRTFVPSWTMCTAW